MQPLVATLTSALVACAWLACSGGGGRARERPAAAAAPTRPPGAAAEAPPAPIRAESVVPAAALAGDLVILRRAFEALHPGLLRYNTRAELAAHFAALAAELGRDRPLTEAFLALSRFTAQLRCGHSYPSFYNQSEAIAAALFQAPRLPVLFRWIDGAMVITRSLRGDPRLPRGTVIERIDGHASGAILAALLPLVRADGHNDGKRVSLLNVGGSERFESFDIYYPMVFPWRGSDVRLDVRRPDGTRETVAAPLLSFSEREAAVPPPPESDPAAPLWTFRWLDERTGYLKMPTWVAYKTKWPWERELHATMGQLAARRARSLIVDLRGNEGGNDVGDVIVAHLVARPLALAAYERRVRYRTVPEDLRRHLDTWDPSFFDWGRDAEPLADGWFRLRSEGGATARVIEPVGPRFRGEVYVLIDADNSSATFQFAELVQREHLATLIGEPTGGSLRGINGGAFFFLRLPGSGLEVDLPLIGSFPPGSAADLARVPDRGVMPDWLVRTTAADIAAGRDPQLERARRGRRR